MGVCVAKVLTEEWRRNLLLVVFCLHMGLSLFGLVLLAAGVKVGFLLARMDIILDDHYNGSLPTVLASTGGLMAVAHSVAAYLAFMWSSWRTRPVTQTPFLLLKLVLLVVTIFVLTAAAMCYSHQPVIQRAFHHGFLGSMSQYKERSGIKGVIDDMQMTYRCCGSIDFKDWFETSWIQSRFVNVNDRRR